MIESRGLGIGVPKVRHAKPDFCVLQFQGEFARFVNAAAADYEDVRQPAPAREHRPSARTMLGSVSNSTLQKVAADSYGDQSRWTEIAAANSIVDPQLDGIQTIKIPVGE